MTDETTKPQNEQPLEDRVSCFPHDEWEYLRQLLLRLEVDLGEFAGEEPGLFSDRLDELADLLVKVRAYIHFIEAGESRVYLRQWHDWVRQRLQELAAER